MADLEINGVTYNGVETIDVNGTGFYPDAVRYNEQSLSEAQKEQARTNIGALAESELDAAIDTALAEAKESGEFDGATGERGTGILVVTTAPTAYTTATGGFTPAYRIALSTVLTQAKVDEVLVGDMVKYSYYTYQAGYVDASYVYLGTRVSIRGATGSAGTAGADGYTPVRGTDYWTEADIAEIKAYVDEAILGGEW